MPVNILVSKEKSVLHIIYLQNVYPIDSARWVNFRCEGQGGGVFFLNEIHFFVSRLVWGS